VKILLDECVPAKLCKHLSSHDCTTVTRAGLSGYENGELLRKAENLGFDVLVTVDQNLPHQQRIEGRSIAVLILIAASNQIQDLLPLVPPSLEALKSIRSGQVIRQRERE
jgi:predicted nuclease of predicted toxin-antitoxin system